MCSRKVTWSLQNLTLTTVHNFNILHREFCKFYIGEAITYIIDLAVLINGLKYRAPNTLVCLGYFCSFLSPDRLFPDEYEKLSLIFIDTIRNESSLQPALFKFVSELCLKIRPFAARHAFRRGLLPDTPSKGVSVGK